MKNEQSIKKYTYYTLSSKEYCFITRNIFIQITFLPFKISQDFHKLQLYSSKKRMHISIKLIFHSTYGDAELLKRTIETLMQFRFLQTHLYSNFKRSVLEGLI